MDTINKFVSKSLRELADKIDAGNSNLTESEAMHLAKYIKDVLDDADAEEGYVFNRFYADCMFMNNPIDWEDMI